MPNRSGVQLAFRDTEPFAGDTRVVLVAYPRGRHRQWLVTTLEGLAHVAVVTADDRQAMLAQCRTLRPALLLCRPHLSGVDPATVRHDVAAVVGAGKTRVLLVAPGAQRGVVDLTDPDALLLAVQRARLATTPRSA